MATWSVTTMRVVISTFAFGFLFLAVPRASAQAVTLDGNWWTTSAQEAAKIGQEATAVDATGKAALIRGLFDGVRTLATLLILWDEDAVSIGMHNDYDTVTRKYFANAKVPQVQDGLNVFYSDYRNRSIPVFAATGIILKEIIGTPKAEIEALTEKLRSLKVPQ